MAGLQEKKHAHSLTKVNIQMCQECRRFYIITYEKNDKGEAVETGHELDIHIVSSGVVHPETANWDRPQLSAVLSRTKNDDRKELSCF